MKQFEKPAHTTKWIPVKNLSVVWAHAQRDLNEKHVDRIADSFDPDLFDDLVVTLPNGNGIYHVVDGQHRRAAIQKLFGESENVPCRVVNATEPAQAAAIFDKINTSRKAPSSVEKFSVRVTAGEKTECDINKIVTFLGYHVAVYKSPTTITAVSSLINVYKNFGAEVLKEVLMTIKATWSDDANAVDGPIISGYGELVAEHRGHLNWKRLREQIAKTYTPGQLLGRAKYHKEMAGVSLAEGVRHVLVTTYNQGIRNGKLSG